MKAASLFLALLAVTRVSAQSCTAYANTTACNADRVVTVEDLPSCYAKPEGAQVFVVVGDYGAASAGCEAEVASLIDALDSKFGPLDYVMTVGDNNYYTGDCDSIEENIHQYYSKWYPEPGACTDPTGKWPPVTFPRNAEKGHHHKKDNKIRFFPVLGNHDYDTYAQYGAKLPYLQHFSYLRDFQPSDSLGMYYAVDPIVVGDGNKSLAGTIQLFGLNSNDNGTAQQEWLRSALNQSTAQWKIVFFHHSPYTTAEHDPPATWMRWPFEAWGASLVLTGHEHTYERLLKDADGGAGDFTYIVNGLGGNPMLYDISGPDCPPEPGSVVRYNNAHGAMLAYATNSSLQFCMYTIFGDVVDAVQISS